MVFVVAGSAGVAGFAASAICTCLDGLKALLSFLRLCDFSSVVPAADSVLVSVVEVVAVASVEVAVALAVGAVLDDVEVEVLLSEFEEVDSPVRLVPPRVVSFAAVEVVSVEVVAAAVSAVSVLSVFCLAANLRFEERFNDKRFPECFALSLIAASSLGVAAASTAGRSSGLAASALSWAWTEVRVVSASVVLSNVTARNRRISNFLRMVLAHLLMIITV